MQLLVAGASEVDAGKTTFTTGLIERTGVRGYKPRAGNDYWYDQDDYRDAVDRGRLYGKDAKRLAAAAPGDVRPEAINPIHRLWLPTPGKGKGLLGREGRAFVVDRVTRLGDVEGDNGGENDPRDEYVVNGTVTVPPAAERAFPLDSAPKVESLAALNDLMAEKHKPALAALSDEIATREDAIVESYSDIARPLAGFEPDAVAVVEPRRCRIYPGDRYAKACEVASGSAHEGRLEERVDHVIELLDPVASVTLPALSSEERGDLPVVADAYSEAYDALLSAV
ncbi:ATPase [Natronomonas halophila]|uniref:ATPase n=1 Tax=Natronomonas halophila TaxID=2747817 RepID=UPI0015B58BF2|nr:ATPase [Natronomonas halophila]QLD85042.1 ATPase [Natronomonas halophila]